MDLAVGAKSTWTMMQHNTKDGSPRLLNYCNLPLTAPKCVNRIYTDIAVVDVTDHGFMAIELLESITVEELNARTEGEISLASDCKPLQAPANLI